MKHFSPVLNHAVAFLALAFASAQDLAIWANSGSTPGYAVWDGERFSQSGSMRSTGSRWKVIKGAYSPTRDEAIVVGITIDQRVTAQIYDGVTWKDLPFSPLDYRATEWYQASFDIRYESLTGRAMLVWHKGNTDEIHYRTFDGRSWSMESKIRLPNTSDSHYQIDLVASPLSDEMILSVAGPSSSDNVIVWDGKRWSDSLDLKNNENWGKIKVKVAYEQQSGRAMLLYAKKSPTLHYRIFNGIEWSREGTIAPPSGVSMSYNVAFLSISSDPTSNRLVLGVSTFKYFSFWLAVWDGNAMWGSITNAASRSLAQKFQGIDVAFEDATGRAMAVYSQFDNKLRYRMWSLSNGWSNERQGPDLGNAPNSLRIFSSPRGNNIMLAAQDNGQDANFCLWNGNSWDNVNRMTSNTGETRNRGEPFLFLWKPIDFGAAILAPPTATPTRSPTRRPTSRPTPLPSADPTHKPTATPTRKPTANPTLLPTDSPSAPPTRVPTAFPTLFPTSSPSAPPTIRPTSRPTMVPTETPTAAPTFPLTMPPTPPPTMTPSNSPSSSPPTKGPTSEPSTPPTVRPTLTPTSSPSAPPTLQPTSRPTMAPTETSTAAPTFPLTMPPTPPPTMTPSISPTSSMPTRDPTSTPSSPHTVRPTLTPTSLPTTPLTRNPTVYPTTSPSASATPSPTQRPTSFPSEPPTPSPTQSPASYRTTIATPGPSPVPATGLTIAPSNKPVVKLPPGSGDTDHKIQVDAEPGSLGAGRPCSNNRQCKSSTCRSGVCMASPDCYPIKHTFGTPFYKHNINIVFVASAFDSVGHDAWEDEVYRTYRFMQNYNMFAEEIDELNVFMVDPLNLDESFCNLGCQGFDRLLCCDIKRAHDLGSKCFPVGPNLQTVVIHSSRQYGGAGYTSANIATATMHPASSLVLVHELGHSLFELTDEYSYGDGNGLEANCDTRSCEKWSDLMGRKNRPQGYDRVQCIPGCENGNYFVSGKTFMDDLSHPVGAVNERFSCCTYLALTKKFPSYCQLFDTSPGYLRQYCKKDYQSYGASNYESEELLAIPGFENNDKASAKYMRVADPVMATLTSKTKRTGTIVFRTKTSELESGIFSKSQVKGDFASPKAAAKQGVDSLLKVLVIYRTGKEILFFSRNKTIEIPLPDPNHSGVQDEMPLRVSTESEVLELVLDTKGRHIKSIRAKLIDAR